MAETIVSVAGGPLLAAAQEQIRNEVNLVRSAEEEVQSLGNELNRIRNLLDRGESRRFSDKDINAWLVRIGDTCHEIEDVLDEWNFSLLKIEMEHDQTEHQQVCSFFPSSCLYLRKVSVRREIGSKIKNVKKQLDLIFKEKDRYNYVMSQPTSDPSLQSNSRLQSTSIVDLAGICGREDDKKAIVSKIMAKNGSPQIVSIVGVGGLGKTTLAQLVYNDRQVVKHFDLRIWICVSNSFDLAAIAKGIIESAEEVKLNLPDPNQLNILFIRVKDYIARNRFLLVLDDVWTAEHTKWETLKNSLKGGKSGSTILVTTRNQDVAKRVGNIEDSIHYLGPLSGEDCSFLLRQVAFSGRNQDECKRLEGISKNIANKCKGLPLAAKALGSLLGSKDTLVAWENVLNSEIWEMEELEQQLFPHLLLSYSALSPTHKRCFLYCSVFPKDYVINVEDLIGIWIALGYFGPTTGAAADMELKGRECFDVLAKHCLFHDFERDLNGEIMQCKMHDIVHDFAQFLWKKRSKGGVELGTMKTSCQSCNPSLVSQVKEYRSLFYSRGETTPPDICDCLTSLRVLSFVHHLPNTTQKLKNLIHLRWLELDSVKLCSKDARIICKLYNLQFLRLVFCYLQEIPREIGNLKFLRHIDLSSNTDLIELPLTIYDLCELRTLNLDFCQNLRVLPNGIERLKNLKHLHNQGTFSLDKFPQGLSQLTCLRTLSEFTGGSGWSKMGYLKKLDCLSQSLRLTVVLIDDPEDVVEDAKEADLQNKINLHTLLIKFEDEMSEKEELSVRMDVIDALEPHKNLKNLEVSFYKGSILPSWIASPSNQLRCLRLSHLDRLSSLPNLGKLPCLEEIHIEMMTSLRIVGREFLGIEPTGDIEIDESSSASSVLVAATNRTIGFPKLKVLEFQDCCNWEVWEDITDGEEDDFTAMSFMPLLTEIIIRNCTGLVALPHLLLSKASSLKIVNIIGSTQLQQHYRGKDGSTWESISRNPGFWLFM